MNSSAATSHPAHRSAQRHQRDSVAVEAVSLLGVRVTAYALINENEHQRRNVAQVGAVTNPALLDRLMDLPIGIAVVDPVIWAETADQPAGIVERDRDGLGVRRLLAPPLVLEDVVINAAAGRELSAVRDASLFSGFTRRWMAATTSQIPEVAILEAKACGVGVLDIHRGVQLPAENPASLTIDGWSWLLLEKTYRRWLKKRPEVRVRANPTEATGEARAT